MWLFRRKHGSQRAMKPVSLELMPSTDGDIAFKGEDGVYYIISPKTEVQMRELLSAVHVAHHHFEERRA